MPIQKKKLKRPFAWESETGIAEVFVFVKDYSPFYRAL
jgi:hypothetical protein